MNLTNPTTGCSLPYCSDDGLHPGCQLQAVIAGSRIRFVDCLQHTSEGSLLYHSGLGISHVLLEVGMPDHTAVCWVSSGLPNNFHVAFKMGHNIAHV